MLINLTSTAFEDGGFIPRKYATQGENISPPLRWDNVPDGTRSCALVMDDADGPRVHWIAFDLPPDQRELPEHLPPQPVLPDGPKGGIRARQGKNEFDKIGYSGPVPSRERPRHDYFTLYALDAVLHLAPGAGRDKLLAAMHGHILDEGRLMAMYSE